jgi:hypothetical protein
MSIKKFAVGCFDNETVLLPAVYSARKTGYKIHDVYTPMPVHGLDQAMGLRETRLHTAGFIYGLLGMILTLVFIGWTLMSDWPLNLGGKPPMATLAWIPITFELTVLAAAVGMVYTFCYLCQLAPFVRKHHFHPRATDDLFVMVLECTAKTNEAEIMSFLTGTGAMEVDIQVAETGWWWGAYHREQKLYREKTETLSDREMK